MALLYTALTTVARVEEIVGEGAYSTSIIERRINAVSAAFDRFLDRKLARATVTTTDPEYYQGNGRVKLYVRRRPIISVTRVQVDGQTITDYESLKDFFKDGILYRSAGWPLRCPAHADLTGDPDVSMRAYNINLAYIGGYKTANHGDDVTGDIDLPADIEDACIDEVAGRLGSPRANGIVKERTAGGWSREWASAASSTGSGLHPDTESALSEYRWRL